MANVTDRIKGLFGQRGKAMTERGKQQGSQVQQKIRQVTDRMTDKR